MDSDSFAPQVAPMLRQGDTLYPVESLALDESASLEGLTGRQYQFAKAVFSGASYTEAYRSVYDVTGLSESAVSKRASAEAMSPPVAAKIRALRLESDRQATLAPRVTADFVTEGIRDLALNAENESVRLAAYVHLGKTRMVNLFGNQAPDTERKPRSAADVERELKAFLAELTPTLDVTARDVTPAKQPRSARKRKA